jgi:SNF2 family DNA or RNA helicase
MWLYKGTLPWLTINVEAFSTDGADDYLAKYRKKYKRLLIVVDESTTIKAPKSKRAKKVVKLCRTGAYRRIMTGSPLPESPLDAWAQYKALGDDMLGYPSYVGFKRRFAVEEIKQFGSRSFIQVVGYQNLDELGVRMGKCSSRLTKAECLDLPDKVYNTAYVDMEASQARVYKRLRDELLVELDSGLVSSAPHALTKLVRLHQVALGYLVGDEGGIEDLSNKRYDVLLDLLEEAGDASMIVWSNFRYPLGKVTQELQKRYGVSKVVAYHGGVSDAGRKEALERFLSGDARYFVSNPSVGGYGITLTNCHNVVYFSNGFKSEARMQSEDRCHRIGQRNKVTYTDLVARGTIDQRVLDSLASKRDLAEQVLGDKLRQLLM